MRVRFLWCALLFAGCVPGFDDFQVVDDAGRARDAGGPSDAGPTDGGGDAGPSDAGLTDGGPDTGTDAGPGFVPTALDTECETVWAAGGCAGREVVTVAEPFLCRDVAVALASDGEITAAFNEETGPDSGRIDTVSFHEDTPGTVTAGPAIEPEATFGDVVGIDLDLATESPNIHHLAYWLRSDFGHEVRYRRLRAGAFTPVQTLAAGVGRDGVVDVEVDSDGLAVVAWHDDVSGEHAARREGADESFAPRAGLRRDGDPRVPGAGAVALHAGATSEVHAAYQWGIRTIASAPSYSVSTSAGFSTARTLDNQAVANRASGVGVELTLLGDEVVVAYLDWIAGVGELRFARFVGSEVRTEVYLGDLFIEDLPGDHPIVIDTDSAGLLSMLVADSSATLTRLQWHRQTRVGGDVRWLVDTIAEIPATAERVHVDMKLGPDRRPHVLFWDPSLAVVRYATARP